MTVKVTDKDKGFRRVLNALGKHGSVHLGVQGSDAERLHPGGDITIGELAAIHELGLGVPERSWLRAWVDQNRGQILKDAEAAVTRILTGQLTRQQALELLGQKWVAEIQARILQGGVTPELAEQTKKRKGSSVPLLDTGQLVSAITYLAKLA